MFTYFLQMSKAALFRNHEMIKNSEGAQNQEVIPRYNCKIDKAVERFDCNPMKRFTNQRIKDIDEDTWGLQKGQRAFPASTPEELFELVKRNYYRLLLSSRAEDREFTVKPVQIVKELITIRSLFDIIDAGQRKIKTADKSPEKGLKGLDKLKGIKGLEKQSRKEHEMEIDKIIPELRMRRSDLDQKIEQHGAHQSINQGFSNFIWRGYEYEAIRHYIDVINANTAAMNLAICLGFQISYSLMPTLMLTMSYFDFDFLLRPDAVKSFKHATREWSPQLIKLSTELCESINQSFMHATGSTLETGGATTFKCEWCGTSAESNETEIFDPMGIIAREESSHKVVLRKLVIACLAVCILSTVSYITVGGTELCLQFREGRFKE